MSWAMRWRLKLYREEQFLMEVGTEFHVAGELQLRSVSKMLLSVKFAEDKVLTILILCQKC